MAVDAMVLWAGRPRQLTRTDLVGDALGLRARVPYGGAAAIRARHAPLVAAALIALQGWARTVDLVPADLPSSTDADAVLLTDEDVVGDDAAIPATGMPQAAIETVWRLRTSGTTGAPRRAEHALASLSRAVRPLRQLPDAEGPAGSDRRWGLLYPPTRMAGLQVLLQALGAGEVVCDATHVDGLGRRVAWLKEHGVNALSATPTVWRQILQSQAGPGLPLRQVTLGGEIATQDLLDALRRTYPEAKITHVYATTETGSVFAVSDGRAGFPATFVTADPADSAGSSAPGPDAPGPSAPGPHAPTGSGPGLHVRDGVLRVWAPWSSAAGADGFVTTGDLVEIHGDRVHFLGRADGIVNVGGQKVLPEQTEAVLLTHERVADARVTVRRNVLAGAILVAEVVLTRSDGVDAAQLTCELRELVRQRLSKAHAPASVTVVTELPMTSTGKAVR
jgi:acyl-coenzyme A synthetase/AMP-(fatty) acid ligase